MIIKNLFIEPINIELDEPFKIAIVTKYCIENVFVTVVLDNGIEGYGEAAQQSHFDSTPCGDLSPENAFKFLRY